MKWCIRSCIPLSYSLDNYVLESWKTTFCWCTKLAVSTAVHVFWILEIIQYGEPRVSEILINPRGHAEPASNVIDWRTLTLTAVSAVEVYHFSCFTTAAAIWPNNFTTLLCEALPARPSNRKLNLCRLSSSQLQRKECRPVWEAGCVCVWERTENRGAPCSCDGLAKISYRVSRKMLLIYVLRFCLSASRHCFLLACLAAECPLVRCLRVLRTHGCDSVHTVQMYM